MRAGVFSATGIWGGGKGVCVCVAGRSADSSKINYTTNLFLPALTKKYTINFVSLQYTALEVQVFILVSASFKEFQ